MSENQKKGSSQYKGNRGEGKDRKPREMTNRPFQALKGMKVGPACLACGEPITRMRDQRQGYLHNTCEQKVARKPQSPQTP